jgi:hypothetical protein
MNINVDSVATILATKHKCMDSLEGKIFTYISVFCYTCLSTCVLFIYIGYIEPDSSLLLAAGHGIAKAIDSKPDHFRFAGEIMENDTFTEDDCDNDDGQVKSSKSCSFKNSKRESTNENDKMAVENNTKKTKTLDMSDGKKIIIMNFTF